MKIRSSSASIVTQALIKSLNIEIMQTITRRLIDGYDLHERTGIPENIPIQKTEAARQIVSDIRKMGLFTHFISLLVEVHFNGLMGRKYPIHNMNGIIREIQDYGFLYDRQSKMFVEDPSVRVSRNWGVMREGEEYIFTFLRLDIAGNTKLVKKYPYDLIQETYSDLKTIVENAVLKRHGRIWNWEGDGGLVAFHFSNKNLYAVLSAMEIIHNLFLYNKMKCKLEVPLEVRVAVHNGPCEYTENEEDLKKNEPIKKIIEIESEYTVPNTVSISDTTCITLDKILADQFTEIDTHGKGKYYRYELIREE